MTTLTTQDDPRDVLHALEAMRERYALTTSQTDPLRSLNLAVADELIRAAKQEERK